MCFGEATGESLVAMPRPGDAGSNTTIDHLDVLDAAVAELPSEIARTKRPASRSTPFRLLSSDVRKPHHE